MDLSRNFAFISSGCGAVVLVVLQTYKAKSMVRLMNFLPAVSINIKRSAIVIASAENKNYELNITNSKEGDETLLTN